MESWPTLQSLWELAWMGGLAATPLALVVEAVLRLRPVRPATRHALWAAVLFSFVTPAAMRLVGVSIDRPIIPAGWFAALAPSSWWHVGDVGHEPDAMPWTASVGAGDEAAAPAASQPIVGPMARPALESTKGPSFEWPIGLVARDMVGSGRAAAPWQGDLPARTPADLHAFDPVPTAAPHTDSSRPPSVRPLAHSGDSRWSWDGWGASINWDAHQGGAGLAESRGSTEARTSGPTDENKASAWRVDVRSTMVAAWLAGIVALVGARGARTLSLRRLIARARPAPERVVELVHHLARELGMRRAPRTLITLDCVSPMVWCGVRPCLVIPTNLWTTLDDVSRCAIVVHELAHLRRRDHVLCWCEWLVGTLYWWHPVAWWVRRRLRDEAEASCDAWVTSILPHGRRAFAEALLVTKAFLGDGVRRIALAPSVAACVCDGPALGVVSGRSLSGRTRRLARRITMVMTLRTTPRISMRGVLLALTVAGVGAFVTPGLACPPKEESQAAPSARRTETVAGAAARAELEAERAVARRNQQLRGRAVAGDPVGDQFFGEAAALEAMRGLGGRAKGGAAPLAAEAPLPPMPPLPPQAPPPPRAFGGQAGGSLGGAFAVQGDPLARGAARATIAPRAAIGPMATANGPAEGTEPRAYYLPQGKLEAMAELMSRQDVPVWIERQGDHLVVYASPQGHQVFAAFVAMIHPEGGAPAVRRGRSPAGLAPRSGVDALPNGQLRAQLEAINQERSRVERQADHVREQAEATQERAEQLQALAADLDAHVSSTDDEAARAALAAAQRALNGRGAALRTQSERLESELASLEGRMEQLEELLGALEARLDAEADAADTEAAADDDDVATVELDEVSAARAVPGASNECGSAATASTRAAPVAAAATVASSGAAPASASSVSSVAPMAPVVAVPSRPNTR